MPGYEIRHPTFRARIYLDPIWERLGQTLRDRGLELTWEVTRDLTRDIGQLLIRGMREVLGPHCYTGRLARSLGMKFGPSVRRSGRIIPGQTWLVIGVYRSVPELDESIARHPRMYATALELGSAPHARPWGTLSAQRIRAWAKARGIPDERVRFILGAIYLRGTKAHPFVEPAVRWAEPRINQLVEERAQEIISRIEEASGTG